MSRFRNRTWPRFSLRSLLAAITWSALVLAICVGQQRAAVKQRQVLEQLKAAGILPVTTVGGRPVTAPQSVPVSNRRGF